MTKCKYSGSYIRECMEDFEEFRRVLKTEGYVFSAEVESNLYMVMMRIPPL